MASWDRKTYYYSGQGVLLTGPRDASGNAAGLTAMGNVTDLKIGIETSTLEHKDSQSGQRAVDFRLTTETKATLTVTVENYVRDVLATALRGQSTSIAAGSVVAAPSVYYTGKVVALAHVKVSAVAVKKGATTLTPYVNDATDYDYKLNAEAGSIWFNDGLITPQDQTDTGFADGDALTVDYTYQAQARVDALTVAQPELFMRFEGLNTLDGNNPVVVEAFRFVPDPAAELALISGEEAASFELTGSLLIDSTRSTGSKYFHQRLVR